MTEKDLGYYMSQVKYDGDVPMPAPRSRYSGIVRPGKAEVKNRGDALSRELWIGDDWSVTVYGIERRDGLYHIEVDRLEEYHEPSWCILHHIAEKGEEFAGDFASAFLVACTLHKIDIPLEIINDGLQHFSDPR